MRFGKIGEEIFRWAMIMFLITLFLIQSYCTEASPLPPRSADVVVPSQLSQWRDWVLWRNEQALCPFVSVVVPLPKSSASKVQQDFCGWPQALEIEVSEQGARFNQQWQLYGPTAIPLPGSSRHWPQLVEVNGQKAVVSQLKGQPVIRLPAGNYRVSGSIPWLRIPQALRIAPYTGAIELRQNGKQRHALAFDRQGRLLLGQRALTPVVSEENRLELQVFRKLSDGYPMQLETRLQLAVSGKERRVSVGRLLPEGFVPVALESSVPARIDPDGDVELQLRPGRQQLVLTARAAHSPQQLQMEARTPEWPAQELWSFSPNTAYRVLEVSGAPSIDPSQTLLPAEWQQLSTYLLKPGVALKLVERQRGQSEPSAHRLSLKRDLWLAFDGSELTSRERLSGQIGRIDRLNTAADYRAGSLKINGSAQLITELEGRAGVEVRPGALELVSVGLQSPERWQVTPWQQDLEQAEVRLQLPPGYRLFHASGVDRVSDSWVSSWNLWSIFIATLFVVLLYRLFAWQAAVLGALYVLVMHGINGAPSLIWWLLLIGCWAGQRYLPAGRLCQGVTFAYRGIWLALTLLFLGFAVDQARQALYPQLERPWQQLGTDVIAPRSTPPPAPANEVRQLSESVRAKSGVLLDRVADSAPQKSEYSYQYRPDSAIQTGPGLPSWRWREVQLRWSGPVAAEQTVQLHLMPPALNRALNLARIVLFLGVAAWLLGIKLRWPPRLSTTVSGSVLLLLMLGQSQALMADVPAEMQGVDVGLYSSAWPSPELLQEYRQRLLAPPRCAPECTAIHQASLQIDEQLLTLDLQLSQQSESAVALPVRGSERGAVHLFEVGGRPAALRLIGDQLYSVLPAGNHRVRLQLAVNELDQLVLPFVLPAHQVSVQTSGWRMTGVHEGRLQGRSISLTRISQHRAASDQGISPRPAPAFVEITRSLEMGLEWRMHTRVRRVAPQSGPIALQVPLLEGESVTSANVRVTEGQVHLNFAPNQRELSWQSQLPITGSLTLKVPEQEFWVERWRVRPSLRWHLVYQGLSPVRTVPGREGLLEWWPHNGEQLDLQLSQPAPLAGEQLTLDRVALEYRPGRRISKARLQLTARTSQGREWPLVLPAGAELESLELNGDKLLPNRQGETLLIPLRPGENQLQLRWSEAQGYSMRLTSPVLELGPAANVALNLRMPTERWVLMLGGPAMGPAVLFWGVLLVVVVIAQILGRQPWSPLSPLAWTLLGAGVVTTEWPLLLVIAAWFLLLCARPKLAQSLWVCGARWRYNGVQVLLLLLTLAMLLSLLASVAMGLVFSEPAMQVAGNGSSAFYLNWYQDRISGQLPEAWVLSVPMLVYRLLILAWSLWLSMALIRWLRWGWQQLSQGGFWMPKRVLTGNKVDEGEGSK